MRKLLVFSAFLLMHGFSYSKEIHDKQAKVAALSFIQNFTLETITTTSDLQLVYKGIPASQGLQATQKKTYFYIFNIGSHGFVIVAGDDQVWPILGYSLEGRFDPKHVGPQTLKWLEGYKSQIRYVVEHQVAATPEIEGQWNGLLYGSSRKASARMQTVNPLVATRWNQEPYYNAICPFDNTANSRAVTGCVATAMAQIMKYWNYPATGTGFHSYNHAKYGTLSANYGSTTYQWSSMPNSVTSSNSAVATLMYQIGVSVDMNYGPASTGGSGAYVISSASPVTNCSEYALKTYFGYRNTLQGKQRANYSDAQWVNLLKTEFDAGRPVLYAGFGGGGGHCFVADGYDNSDYIHFNWGWGGNSDGYFQINALNPGALGAGGGTGGFNSGQQAVVGIQPPAATPTNQTYDLKLYNYITPSSTSVGYGNAFTVSTNIFNSGAGTFNGDYGMAIFDNAYNFVDFVEVKSGQTLQGGYVYNNNITFSTAGLFSLLPGNYFLGLFSRPSGGNWTQVSDNGNYSNLVQFKVVNANTIELNSAMTVTPATGLINGQPASVNLNIKNTGSTTFTGEYQLNLYNLDGSFVQAFGTINESSGLPPGYTYVSPYLTFSTNAITANPGTYLIALVHKATNGNLQLTGCTSFQNPIKVVVKAASIAADRYEVNNTATQAYTLPVNFTSNSLSITTSGSNCHIGSDYDYYKITLPAGFSYTITPRLHDSYNSGNGNTYSLDALFSYSTNGLNWSDAFDDLAPSSITVNGGTTVYFAVSPYFTGETGTYLLDITLNRTVATALPNVTVADGIRVSPIPATNNITVDMSGYNGHPLNLKIYNAQGQVIKSLTLKQTESRIDLPLNGLPSGIYVLELQTNKGTFTQKIIVQK